MLRSFVITAVVLGVLSAGVAVAGVGTSGFGLGVQVGEPTGLNGRYWLSSATAIDAAAAWSFGSEDALQLQADYVIHNFSLINVKKGLIGLYFGIGGKLKLDDDSTLGIRIPVGGVYIIDGTPLDVFVEIVPVLDLAPSTDFTLNGALGMRYFFGSKSSN